MSELSRDTQLLREVKAVLASEQFARSPMQSRLLEFLVNECINGNSEALTSYTIAVDGLGRSNDFDPSIDSYARVQIGRLRKSMDVFYATEGARRSPRLLIETGTYQIQLMENDLAAGTRRIRSWFSRIGGVPQRAITLALLAMCALVGLVITVIQSDNRDAIERWHIANFPVVRLDVNDYTDSPTSKRTASSIRQYLATGFSRYQSIGLSLDKNTEPDYNLLLVITDDDDDKSEINVFVSYFLTKETIWADRIKLSKPLSDDMLEKKLSKIVFWIANPTGVIHPDQRRRDLADGTPYGCWMKFSEMLQDNRVLSGVKLAECSEKWHAANPQNPLASALYGWSLVDQAIMVSGGDRRRSLLAAIELLEGSKTLHPNSVLLLASLFRAYAFAGDTVAMQNLAGKLIEHSPGNYDIIGLVGTMLTMHNDPRGAALVNEAIKNHSNPPNWYFCGKFVSAMMEDDPVSAGKAIGRIKKAKGQGFYLALRAAYEARSGQLDRARVSLDKYQQFNPRLKNDPDSVTSQMPWVPEVRQQFRKWLEPLNKEG